MKKFWFSIAGFIITFLLVATVTLAQTQTAQFTVSWVPGSVLADGSNAPTGFKLERALTSTGTFAQITLTTAAVTSFVDSIANDPGGTVYCYRVKATNAAGDSASYS